MRIKQLELTLAMALLISVGSTDDHDRCRELFDAIDRGDTKAIGSILKYENCINCRGTYGYTPLSYAAKKNKLDIVRLLCDKGASPDTLSDINESKGESGFSPLIWAAIHCSLPMAELLIQKGANVNLVGREFDSPLIVASENGCLSIVRLLLDEGADIEYATDRERLTALFSAVRASQFHIAEYLVSKGALLESKLFSGETLLMAAASGSNYELVKFFVDKGLEVNATDKYGNTVVHYLVQHNPANGPKIIDFLVNKGANHNQKNFRGQSPLMLAARDSSLELTRWFINSGDSVNNRDEDGNTALHYACFGVPHSGENRIVSVLVEAGALADARDNMGRTPLMLACNSSDISAARFLLSHGANVNSQSDSGWTSLMYAARWGQMELIELLIRNGANLGIKNSDGMTATMIAEKYLRSDAVRELKRIEQSNKKKDEHLDGNHSTTRD